MVTGFSKSTSFEGSNHAHTFKSVGKAPVLQPNPSFATRNSGRRNGKQNGPFNSDSVGGGFTHSFVSTGSASEAAQLMSQQDHFPNQGHPIVQAPQGQLVIHGQQVPSTSFHAQKRHQIIHAQNGPQIDNAQSGIPFIHGQHGPSMFHVQQGHPVHHRTRESQSMHGHRGLQTVQEQEHRAIQDQARTDFQGHQVAEGQQNHHTIEIHNAHTPVESHQIHHTKGSHSFSTTNVGPIFSSHVNSPSQILKTISTANTGQMGENNPDAIFIPQSFGSHPFPRNFILPKRHREHKSLQHEAINMLQTEFKTEQQSAKGHQFDNTHGIHPPDRTDNPQERNGNGNPESSHNTNKNPQSSQNNLFGFASLDNPHFRDGGFHHGGIQNVTTLHGPMQFGNGLAQLGSSHRDSEVNRKDVMMYVYNVNIKFHIH